MPLLTIGLTGKQVKLVIIILIGLVGMFCLFVGLFASTMNMSASSWPVTEGNITSSEVVDWGAVNHHDYRPQISYQFQVGGRYYSSSQISSGAIYYSGDGSKEATEIVNRYPVGSQVQVHYNPNNPSNAVLETQSGLTEQVPLIIGVIMTAAALIGVFLIFRSERKS